MKRSTPIWLTIAIAVAAFVTGLLIDFHHVNAVPKATEEARNPKIKAIIDLILDEYVDSLNKMAEGYFSAERERMATGKRSAAAAFNYYTTMNNFKDIPPQFLDEKN